MPVAEGVFLKQGKRPVAARARAGESQAMTYWHCLLVCRSLQANVQEFQLPLHLSLLQPAGASWHQAPPLGSSSSHVFSIEYTMSVTQL